MHEMILGLLSQHHQVADVVGVRRYVDAQSVFYGAHRCQGMHPRANAANPLGKRPRITWIATLQYDLQAAPHIARGHGVADYVVIIDIDLDTQVAFDAANRIDDDALSVGVKFKAVRSDCLTHCSRLPYCCPWCG